MKKISPTTETKKPIQRGKFIYKPIISVITVCGCGNKYVSTRLKQTTCLTCLKNA